MDGKAVMKACLLRRRGGRALVGMRLMKMVPVSNIHSGCTAFRWQS